MNGEKNKDLELQKFYDAEGNEITMLDNVDKEGTRTQAAVKDMFNKFKSYYSGSTAGVPRKSYLTQDNFEELMKTNKDFARVAKGNPYYSGLLKARRENRGM